MEAELEWPTEPSSLFPTSSKRWQKLVVTQYSICRAVKHMGRCHAIPYPTHLIKYDFLLQEDGNGSHGHLKHGLAQALCDAEHFQLLLHPPFSPDSTLMRLCWNVIKQRTRKRFYQLLIDFNAILQDEWSKHTEENLRTGSARHHGWFQTYLSYR